VWTDGASVVLTEEYDCTGGPGWGVTIGRGKTCSLTAIGGIEVVHNKRALFNFLQFKVLF